MLEASTVLAVRHYRYEPLFERVRELRHNVTVYNANYVALAEVLGAPLLTEDRAIAVAPGLRCRAELFT